MAHIAFSQAGHINFVSRSESKPLADLAFRARKYFEHSIRIGWQGFLANNGVIILNYSYGYTCGPAYTSVDATTPPAPRYQVLPSFYDFVLRQIRKHSHRAWQLDLAQPESKVLELLGLKGE